MLKLLAELTDKSFAQVVGTGTIILIVGVALAVIGIAALVIYFYDPSWFSRRISIIKAVRSRLFVRGAMGNKELQKAVKDAGFIYDFKQDIFFASMNPWQRQYGYCRMYDELCPPFGMIVDSEPIYFYYGGKNWLIEFWKGQYDLTTGCEVGVYTKEGAVLDHPDKAFYECAGNSDRLFMSYVLKREYKTLFTRVDKHWWLTGFSLGEFSEPSDLTMQIKITFKNRDMRDAFVGGLKQAGYTEKEYYMTGNTVHVVFNKPHSRQPYTRTPVTDSITQEKNFILCKTFVDITSSELNMKGKMHAVEDKAPELMVHILNMGKHRAFFEKLMGRR